MQQTPGPNGLGLAFGKRLALVGEPEPVRAGSYVFKKASIPSKAASRVFRSVAKLRRA